MTDALKDAYALAVPGRLLPLDNEGNMSAAGVSRCVNAITTLASHSRSLESRLKEAVGALNKSYEDSVIARDRAASCAERLANFAHDDAVKAHLHFKIKAEKAESELSELLKKIDQYFPGGICPSCGFPEESDDVFDGFLGMKSRAEKAEARCKELEAMLNQATQFHAKKEIALLDLSKLLNLTTEQSNELLVNPDFPGIIASRIAAQVQSLEARLGEAREALLYAQDAFIGIDGPGRESYEWRGVESFFDWLSNRIASISPLSPAPKEKP